MADLSLVVVAAGRHDHLERALVSWYPSAPRTELVLVDLLGDGAVHEVATAAGVRFAARRDVSCPAAPGGALRLAAGRNLGATRASTGRLCFVDVDCVVTPATPPRWVDAIDEHPDALLMPPVRYLRPDWTRHVDAGDEVGGASWCSSSEPAARPAPVPDRPAGPDETDLFWSLAFCCSAAAFGRTGGFDESYVGYGAEDTDFARRAQRCGVPLVWIDAPPTFHQHHAPSRFDEGGLAQLVANARRFRARWGDWPMPGWLRELDDAGLLVWDPDAGVLQVADRADAAS